jgi:hypothetical protein
MYLGTIKAICEKHIVNIILNRKMLKTLLPEISSKIRTFTTIHIILKKQLARALGQKKEINVSKLKKKLNCLYF